MPGWGTGSLVEKIPNFYNNNNDINNNITNTKKKPKKVSNYNKKKTSCHSKNYTNDHNLNKGSQTIKKYSVKICNNTVRNTLKKNFCK